MEVKVNTKDIIPTKKLTNSEEIIKMIDLRVIQLIQEIENHKLSIIRLKKKYEKKFNLKYAKKILELDNKIIQVTKKINKFNEVRKTHEGKENVQI